MVKLQTLPLKNVVSIDTKNKTHVSFAQQYLGWYPEVHFHLNPGAILIFKALWMQKSPEKMAYSCCFSLGGNLDFPEFLQKKFYNINFCTCVTRVNNK